MNTFQAYLRASSTIYYNSDSCFIFRVPAEVHDNKIPKQLQAKISSEIVSSKISLHIETLLLITESFWFSSVKSLSCSMSRVFKGIVLRHGLSWEPFNNHFQDSMTKVCTDVTLPYRDWKERVNPSEVPFWQNNIRLVNGSFVKE